MWSCSVLIDVLASVLIVLIGIRPVVVARGVQISVSLVLLVLFVFRSYLAWHAWLLDHPVEHVVIFVTHPIKQILEQLSQIADVGLLLELQATTVTQVKAYFLWQILAQLLYLGG